MQLYRSSGGTNSNTNTTANATIVVENDIDRISDNAYVRIEESEYKINDISEVPVPVSGQISPYGLHLGSFENDEWVYWAKIDATLKDGVYKTYIVSDCVSPISLILN